MDGLLGIPDSYGFLFRFRRPSEVVQGRLEIICERVRLVKVLKLICGQDSLCALTNFVRFHRGDSLQPCSLAPRIYNVECVERPSVQPYSRNAILNG